MIINIFFYVLPFFFSKIIAKLFAQTFDQIVWAHSFKQQCYFFFFLFSIFDVVRVEFNRFILRSHSFFITQISNTKFIIQSNLIFFRIIYYRLTKVKFELKLKVFLLTLVFFFVSMRKPEVLLVFSPLN